MDNSLLIQYNHIDKKLKDTFLLTHANSEKHKYKFLIKLKWMLSIQKADMRYYTTRV